MAGVIFTPAAVRDCSRRYIPQVQRLAGEHFAAQGVGVGQGVMGQGAHGDGVETGQVDQIKAHMRYHAPALVHQHRRGMGDVFWPVGHQQRFRIGGEIGGQAEWLDDRRMKRVRGAPMRPQTQGKIERWHQTLKNRILLENHFLRGCSANLHSRLSGVSA